MEVVEFQVNRVQLDKLDHRVKEERVVQEDNQDHQVHQVHRVAEVIWVHKDLKDNQASLVPLDQLEK